MRVPLFHVNAFTGPGLSGNPAGVCLLDSWLDDDWLRKVAAENTLSTTAFLVTAVNDTLIVVCEDQSTIEDTTPDLPLLERLHPNVVCITAPGNDADLVSRYFAPSYGVPEDPVTGSVHAGLAPYWANRLSKSSLHAPPIIRARWRTAV